MKAWQLFKSNKDWCRRAFAQTINGQDVTSSSGVAVRWCAAGAIRKVYSLNSQVMFDMEIKLSHYVKQKTRFMQISAWNDSKHQRWNKVKAVLKRLDI